MKMDLNFQSKKQCVCTSANFISSISIHHCILMENKSLSLNNIGQYKFVGLIFDNKLNFIPHIQYLKSKCKKALNVLQVVSHYDWGADRKVLLRLYRALIRSKLDYGSFIYGSARASYIKTLDPIHNQGLRLCL